MKKKVAGMPVWLLVAIVAAGGYYVYTRYRKAKEEEGAVPSGEGVYPTTGPIPPEGAGGSSPGGGMANVGETLSVLEQLKAFEEKEPKEKPEAPGFFESLFERLLNERLEPKQAPGGKGHKKPKAGKPSKNRKPRQPRTDHKGATHQHTQHHRAAKHPRERIGVGPGKPAQPNDPARRPRKGGGKRRRRR